MKGDGLAGMYCVGVTLPLKLAEAAGRYGEAFGVNEEGGRSDIYGEEIPSVESADEGVGGELNFIGDCDGKLGRSVDGVDGTFDEVLLVCIQGFEFL